MTNGEWLLKNHVAHVSLYKATEKRYAQLLEDTPIEDETIEGMALGRPSMDCVALGKSNGSHGSPTEYIAFEYAEVGLGQRRQVEERMAALRKKMVLLDGYMKIFASIMAGLNKLETWIVMVHYKLPVQTAFENGGKIRYERDAFKRIAAVFYDDDVEPRYRVHYDSMDNGSRIEDNALGRELVTMPDASGRYYRLKETQNRDNVYTETLEYDAFNRVSKRKELVGAANAYETSFTYDTEGKMLTSAFGKAGAGITYSYDVLGRMSSYTRKGSTTSQSATLAYLEGGYGAGSTTSLVKSSTQPQHMYAYLYDAQSHIVQETHNDMVTRYVYDMLGQLIRVDDPYQLKSICYQYDLGQNIMKKAEYAYTLAALDTPVHVTAYSYQDTNWKDKLTSYDGISIASDSIGCVIDDGHWRYTWCQGHTLARMECLEDAIDFTYSAGGMRIRKSSTIHGITDYVWSAAALVHMKKGATEMHFWHLGQGRPDMVTYDGKEFYYVYNTQGDVIALLDREKNCTEVVTYMYDVWGRPISCEGTMKDTLGKDNPFRYRGYVFDEETGLYYLGGRYYNPAWGRFISGSAPSNERNTMLHQNMFVYCGNAPAQFTDPSAVLVYGGTFSANALRTAQW